MKSNQLFFLSLFSALASAAPIDQTCPEAPQPICRDLILPIEATAQSTVFPAFPNSTLPGVLLEYIGSLNHSALSTQPISGIYNISATYCEPTVKVEDRESTIQMLLHGVAYTKSYWSGIGYPYPTFPGEYSWVAHANSQGYATLAIDNLGNGESSHPDPLSVVQSPLQVEIMREIISRLRAGSLPSISNCYKKVIFTTHSYGSIIGRTLATSHPNDGADAYVLTGASNNLTGIQPAIFNFHLRAASVVDPLRFADSSPGYVGVSAQGLLDTVYSLPGDYDPNVLAWDLSNPHVLAVGELASVSPTFPSNFTGPVMVLTGRYDQIACGVGNITTLDADCGVGRTSSPDHMRLLFPKASRLDTYIPDRTGHDINTHYSAPESFGAAHQWLESVGF